ncbi:hypothetical protein AvCA_13460 [Azotobacter vinelandii CA]|uniref:Uncharacterized protein n=2 Tax=Azotobacter vinelandii TaxID=354 RepID=C1DQC0_AZOVD|nr:hypothetical protein Avin_13460 [Azotobacter vinelandii DJ]AGK17023.1 hypothetical protein AvCA_13460 [Azotobacter vinelandii CA]AGK19864.1 hypothetical protein AvCA6_13460 [Azotobacter vinelandii CA6]
MQRTKLHCRSLLVFYRFSNRCHHRPVSKSRHCRLRPAVRDRRR